MFDSLTNRAEFFSDHYLDARLAADLGDLRAAWETAEGAGTHTARAGLRSLPKVFFDARAEAVEAGRTRRADAVRALNDTVLEALGFTPRRAAHDAARPEPLRDDLELDRAGGTDVLTVPAAATVESPTGLLLVALDCGLASDVDELFDATDADTPTGATDTGDSPGALLEPLHRDHDKTTVRLAADAPGELFSVDDPPRFVLLCAGTTVLLAERSKWAEGRFLAIDLDAALERADATARGELETIAALFSADSLVPGHLGAGGDGDLDAATSVLDRLAESSQRHAVGVSKELREGMRNSVEVLANEVIAQRLAANQAVYSGPNRVDARELTTQCLRYLYRLIVLLYAESRPELGVLPTDDDAYVAGYSLDRLRELTLVDLDDDHARNGRHFTDSLEVLFSLVNDGYHAENIVQQFVLSEAPLTTAGSPGEPDAAPQRSVEDYLQFPGLDATIFDPGSTPLLDGVTLRNAALQEVLKALMLSPGRSKGDSAGFISYAQLGINQLGAVYEGLMAYTGFFAREDLYEVARGGDPSDGTWMVPVTDAGDYPPEVFVEHTDPSDGTTRRVEHRRGDFVFRLAGRDRQRSASYYTPEVLTSCVVRHALAELLGTDDHAREPGGSAGITTAAEILDLTVCEPALGSGAFLNEAINQLAAEYLRRAQRERGEVLDAERYQRELQKVKAHFALHQCYGVDLNATAVELAEVSLWLNSMHPGLKAPWFGLQLRRGNSLVGCRRATWTAVALFGPPDGSPPKGAGLWARERDTTKAPLVPPTDRPLGEPPAGNEIHHFLLPGHGWGAVADRKEAKELAPDAAEALRDWRRAILKAPSPADRDRLVALANGVERLWSEATDVLDRLHSRMRRPLGLYGTGLSGEDAGAPDDDRHTAETILANADSALGRLRLVMDAWVGLWFWPLDAGVADGSTATGAGDAAGPADGVGADGSSTGDWAADDTAAGASAAVTPPSWRQWVEALEAIIGPERTEPTGQLDLFADLAELEAIEEQRAAARTPVADVLDAHPWLGQARDLARREAAWHWELEFAPVFKAGGFDLQVGNPPWVRPTWQDDLTLAEHDAWWGVTQKAPERERKARRSALLERPNVRADYLAEVASAEGLVESVSSPQLRPVLSGIQTNLYMVFMDTVWRHAHERGVSGLLHPEGHFVDPHGGTLRAATYRRLRRHWQFLNGLFLFEDINDKTVFGIHVYGDQRTAGFLQLSYLQHPSLVDTSLAHDGTGPLPSIQTPAGGWDLRPHADRLVTVDIDVLADWARLFDEPGTPPEQARLLRPVTRQDLEALSALADQPVRLSDHEYHWTAGWHEKGAKTDGFIEWRTEVPASWDEVILQGPHFTVATPFAKQPNENCKHNQDYSDWDLESLPERVIPRTNYQRACDRDTYDANLAHWNGRPATDRWRVAWRRMTQPGLERSVQAALIPPGPSHVHTVHTAALERASSTARLGGLWSSLPMDYLVKVSGKADIQDELAQRFPFPRTHPLDSALLLRTLRLNCLTADYAPLWEELWEELWDDAWANDDWTFETPAGATSTADPAAPPTHDDRLAAGPPGRPGWYGDWARPLGDVGPEWTMDTPLRRDAERRQALVELDAIAAIMLGLTAEQLCAMYRTQFAVLRKYEYAMAFDAQGRKICKHHQSAGYRQAEMQALAKDSDSGLPKEWRSIWALVEAEEEHPGGMGPDDGVDWSVPVPDSLRAPGEPPSSDNGATPAFTPPFTRPDREAEMTHAYEVFTARLERPI